MTSKIEPTAPPAKTPAGAANPDPSDDGPSNSQPNPSRPELLNRANGGPDNPPKQAQHRSGGGHADHGHT